MVLQVDDESFAFYIMIIILVGLPIAGFSIGGFTLGIAMVFLSLILVPAVLYFLAVGMLGSQGDHYG